MKTFVSRTGDVCCEQRSFMSRLLRRLLRGPVELSELQGGATCFLWGLAIVLFGGVESPSFNGVMHLFHAKPSNWYGLIILAFGAAQLTTFGYGVLPESPWFTARTRLALGGIVLWVTLTLGAWRTPETATLGLAVSPVFVITSWLTYVRLSAERSDGSA